MKHELSRPAQIMANAVQERTIAKLSS